MQKARTETRILILGPPQLTSFMNSNTRASSGKVETGFPKSERAFRHETSRSPRNRLVAFDAGSMRAALATRSDIDEHAHDIRVPSRPSRVNSWRRPPLG